MKRREFLKQGAAVGAAAAIPGLASAQSTPTLEVLLANALVSGPLKGILEKEAHAKSRQRCEFALVDFGIDFFQHGCVLSVRRKIALDFLIPGELVMARDVISEFRQLVRRQPINSFFDFSQAHDEIVNAKRSARKKRGRSLRSIESG